MNDRRIAEDALRRIHIVREKLDTLAALLDEWETLPPCARKELILRWVETEWAGAELDVAALKMRGTQGRN